MTYGTIQSLIYELTKTNSTSLPVATLNLYTQPAENHVCSLILQADGRWQYDDNNYSDVTTGTSTLVNGQSDYSLSLNQLRIISASIKDVNGIYRRLLPLDPDDLLAGWGPQTDISQIFSSSGLPIYYDLKGGSIFLYPAPDNGINVTLAAGLKLQYQRGPLVFDYTLGTFTDATGSTSSSPGFNSLFHPLIAYHAAYNYAVANLPTLAPGYLNEVQRLEDMLIRFYSKRDKDERQVITVAPIHFR